MNAQKILIVEDERIVANDIQTILKRLGYDISGIFATGEDALQSATDIRPDLVLMDIKLQGKMDGIETARRLYEQFRIPVVYLTAHAHEETLRQAKLTEPFGYIVKPFEERSLHTTIEMAIYKGRMEIQRERLLVQKEKARALIAQSQEALKKSSEELKRSNQELEQFTAIASHDLKAPLSNIIAYTEALQEDFPALGSEEKDYIQVIRKSATRMVELINDLLEFAKLTHKSKDFQEVDLNNLIAEILENLTAKIQEKKAIIEINDLPKINADPLQIRHVFQNLIENALKYCCNGKTHPIIRIFGGITNALAEIHVRDNGIGFDQKHAEEIFLPFKRLQTGYEGTGIGLAICQKIVENHGGFIIAKSNENNGTEFILTLPVIEQENVARDAS